MPIPDCSMRYIGTLLVLSAVLLVSASCAQDLSCSGMSLGREANLNGFIPFPADNAWNKDISKAQVDPNSDAIINFIGANVPLHPDFGSGLYDGSSMGIPYIVVSGSPFVKIRFTAYGSESDPGPMPVPNNARAEGFPLSDDGDRHVLVLDRDNCWLYELYHSYRGPHGSWKADSAAVWDLLNNEHRPYTWTSADAAGLPIFPGLARYDEVAAGQIQHALRFTLQYSRQAFTPPASHWAPNSDNSLAAPMGMRLRLKADYDISSFPAQAKVILTALKHYGMIMADNGSSMFITGNPDKAWDNNDLAALKRVPASAFEVLLMDPIYTPDNLPKGKAPKIISFTANPPTVSRGKPSTLSWDATRASYFVVSPQVGAVRGSKAVVYPTRTTTYTLYATNRYKRSRAKVTVTVQ